MIKSKSSFVNHITKINGLWPLKHMERIKEMVEDFKYRNIIEVELNGLMSLEVEKPLGKEARLHLASAFNLGVGRKLAMLREALANAADVLKNNPDFRDVELVTATSWVVAEKPKFLERLGFTIEIGTAKAVEAIEIYKGRLKGSVVPRDKRHIEPAYSFMSRDKFLQLYSESGEEVVPDEK